MVQKFTKHLNMVRSIEIRNWAALVVLEFELSAMADLGKERRKSRIQSQINGDLQLQPWSRKINLISSRVARGGSGGPSNRHQKAPSPPPLPPRRRRRRPSADGSGGVPPFFPCFLVFSGPSISSSLIRAASRGVLCR
jgi:hypothetical protein